MERLNIPPQAEMPFRFRQRFAGDNYTFRFGRAGSVGGIQGQLTIDISKNGEKIIEGYPVLAAREIFDLHKLDIILIPSWPDGREDVIRIKDLQKREAEIAILTTEQLNELLQ